MARYGVAFAAIAAAGLVMAPPVAAKASGPHDKKLGKSGPHDKKLGSNGPHGKKLGKHQ